METSFFGVTGDGIVRAGANTGFDGERVVWLGAIPGVGADFDLVSASALLVACRKISSSTEPYVELLSRLPPWDKTRACSLCFSNSKRFLSASANSAEPPDSWGEPNLVEPFFVNLKSVTSPLVPSVMKDVAADSACVCCDDHIVSKDVFVEEVAVMLVREKDRAMPSKGFLNVGASWSTSGSTGCLPLDVFVNLGELPWVDTSNARFLEFGDGMSELASTRRYTADIVGDGGV
jgi:hypothetical protein